MFLFLYILYSAQRQNKRDYLVKYGFSKIQGLRFFYTFNSLCNFYPQLFSFLVFAIFSLLTIKSNKSFQTKADNKLFASHLQLKEHHRFPACIIGFFMYRNKIREAVHFLIAGLCSTHLQRVGFQLQAVHNVQVIFPSFSEDYFQGEYKKMKGSEAF